ncbi:N-acetylmuramoyl-L-alanine amidase [Aerococcus kribbianus]|uniref:N-acetylmuramoyl-L-alanine amidase n=1 Tax=Aerococcus kribbianus TaxID=2999064 RepID=A0A9X3JF17_9LACT|nr:MULTISPECIES: N-acetylmuramoyl-L-alanine amidase [unclassified Aerococcus]MCZ0717168.1 N-acetylmuramoyl-L-alanine amidase [Aerococcus sp. YH-aer221]MCZ0725456.1 N-acetylmuramoyl-L-alanine amidase [Aerococcus sp. YH-aer222]
MKTTNYKNYTGVLFAFGHGEGDTGCVYKDYTEAKMIRKLKPYLEKWCQAHHLKAKFYPGNLYYHAKDILAYKNYIVVELHLDAAQKPGAGGHVIIHRRFQADAIDLNLLDCIDQHFGLVTRTSRGLSKRQDLLNLNMAASHGINYRLLELFFLANNQDRDYYLNHLDQVARDIVAAIMGQHLEEESCTCK